MRLIDAESPELQAKLKFIREAEHQIYGGGSWGFTAKCEHAIEDATTIQPESQIIRCKDCLMHGVCRFERGLGLDGYCSQAERRTDD